MRSYTYHEYLGKFIHRRRRESFRFQRRAEIKRSILARTRLKHAFFSQNSTHSPTVWKLRYQKRAKASEEIWSTLADSDSAIFVCSFTVVIFACVSGQRTSYLFLSFFFHCSLMKIRPGQAEKNKKSEFTYSVRQLTIAETMKRCVPLRRNVKPRGMTLKFVLSQLRTCTHENKNMFVFFKSWARVSRVQPRKTRWSQF